MAELRKRFGRLLARHRRRLGLTQEELAEAAGISVDMISKLENGTSGARFNVVERLADALNVDPAQLFAIQVPASEIRRGPFQQITSRLAQLEDAQLEWLHRVLDAVLETPVRPKIPNAERNVIASAKRGRRKSAHR